MAKISSRQVFLKLQNIDDIPTLPVIVLKILKALESESSSAENVGKIITNDQSISTRVLRLANSAFYGFSKRISTISNAIVILGFDTVRQLALATSFFDTLSKISGGTTINKQDFWVHAIATAKGAHLLGEKLAPESSSPLFTAGLLHDVGKLILLAYFTKEYDEILIEVQEKRLSLAKVEKSVLSTDHSEVGGWIARKWRFPEILVNAISSHHSEKENLDLNAAIVAVADTATREAGVGNSWSYDKYAYNPAVLKQIGFTRGDTKKLVKDIAASKSEIIEFLRIMEKKD